MLLATGLMVAAACRTTAPPGPPPTIPPVQADRPGLSAFLGARCARVPLQTHRPGGLPSLEIMVNGRPGTFLLDTGSGPVLVAGEHAGRFDLGPLRPVAELVGIGGAASCSVADVVVLRFAPGAPVWVGSVAVSSLAGANGMGGRPLDGLAGRNMLEQLHAVIDFASGTLWLPRSGADVGSGLAKAAAAHGLAPVRLGRASGWDSATVRINGFRESFVVDSGSQHTIISAAAAKRCGIGIGELPAAASVTGGGGRASGVKAAEIGRLTVGGTGLDAVPALVLNLDGFGRKGQARIPGGILGFDLLAGLGAVYDCGAGVLYLPRGAWRHPGCPAIQAIGEWPAGAPEARIGGCSEALLVRLLSYETRPDLELPPGAAKDGCVPVLFIADVLASYKGGRHTGARLRFATLLPAAEAAALHGQNGRFNGGRGFQFLFLSGRAAKFAPGPLEAYPFAVGMDVFSRGRERRLNALCGGTPVVIPVEAAAR